MKTSLGLLFLVIVASSLSETARVRDKRFIGAFSSWAKKVAHDATKLAEDVEKIAKDSAKTAEETANDVADFAEDTYNKGVQFVENVSKNVGKFTVGQVKYVAKFTNEQVELIKKSTEGAYKFTSSNLKNTYRKAEQEITSKVSKLQAAIPFDAMVDVLLDVIVGYVTELDQVTCEHYCGMSIEMILSSAPFMIGAAAKVVKSYGCPPLCEAALAKLKDYVDIDELVTSIKA